MQVARRVPERLDFATNDGDGFSMSGRIFMIFRRMRIAEYGNADCGGGAGASPRRQSVLTPVNNR
jgi:hypothetical protein